MLLSQKQDNYSQIQAAVKNKKATCCQKKPPLTSGVINIKSQK